MLVCLLIDPRLPYTMSRASACISWFAAYVAVHLRNSADVIQSVMEYIGRHFRKRMLNFILIVVIGKQSLNSDECVFFLWKNHKKKNILKPSN